MLAADIDLTITHPEGYELAPEFVKGAQIEYDPTKAYEGADFVYAKNWSSFKDYGQVISHDTQWKVDEAKMAHTNNAYFMHCLPVRRNVVVDDAVIESPRSLVIPQAANRVVAAQTVLKKFLDNL